MEAVVVSSQYLILAYSDADFPSLLCRRHAFLRSQVQNTQFGLLKKSIGSWVMIPPKPRKLLHRPIARLTKIIVGCLSSSLEVSVPLSNTNTAKHHSVSRTAEAINVRAFSEGTPTKF